MPKRRFASAAVVVAALCGSVAAVPASSGAATGSATYVVDLKDGVDPDRHASAIASEYRGSASRIFDAVLGGFAFRGSRADARRLARDPRVEQVERNLVYRAVDDVPNDLRHLNKVDAPEAHAAGYTGAGVTIAIIDSGIRKTHTVFRSHDNVKRGASCVGDGTFDEEGHGTAVASNAGGRIGVAHEAQLVPVKVFAGGSLNTTLDRLICALNWVRKHNRNRPGHIDVVNISIAGPGSDALKKAVNRVLDAGIVITAAAGNHGGPALFPAAYKGVLAFSALETGKRMASFSAFGADLTGLGVNIFSAENDGDRAYSNRTGSSRVGPQGAAVAAIILGEDPTANVRRIMRISGRCPNGEVNGDTGFCPGQWGGDRDGRAEPLINAYCAGVLAHPTDTDVPRCGF